jgi:hypothetical protein
MNSKSFPTILGATSSDIMIQPKTDYRQFNVCDIFGDLNFDEDGLPVLEEG